MRGQGELTMAQIARALGVGRSTLYQHLDLHDRGAGRRRAGRASAGTSMVTGTNDRHETCDAGEAKADRRGRVRRAPASWTSSPDRPVGWTSTSVPRPLAVWSARGLASARPLALRPESPPYGSSVRHATASDRIHGKKHRPRRKGVQTCLVAFDRADRARLM